MDAIDEPLFDRIADAELHALEKALGELDPDECEVEEAAGVLTLTFADRSKIVVNSHRAARQIWMAAHLPGTRQAWHFSPQAEGEGWRWTTDGAALRPTLAGLVGKQLGRIVPL